MRSYIINFGAAVTWNGRPSGTLRRRVIGALIAGQDLPNVKYLATGGLGNGGFLESQVMRKMMLDCGVAPDSIITENSAHDTLESVLACDAILRTASDVPEVIPCTSRYHIARCAILLRLLGWNVRTVAMPTDAGFVHRRQLATYWLKECFALPYDAALLIFRRLMAEQSC